jgi:Tol biopolymer transport system component
MKHVQPVKRLVALAVAAGMTWLGVIGVGASAQAVVPGASGRILFTRAICSSDARRCWEIVAADPDGTHETVIAGPYRRNVWDDHFIANWSPDGKTVIFMAQLARKQEIWEVNADGTGFHEVFAAPRGTFLDDGPAFTPDGQHIIFTRCCGRETLGYSLWKIDADGTDLHHVTNEYFGPNVDGPSDNLPQVSPDGRLITFNRNVVTCSDPSGCGNRIVTVNIRGGNRVDLTDPSLGNPDTPSWSPDSKRIVFSWFPFDGPSGVVTINADGSGFTQLTFNTTREFSAFASYSPDGTKIIFTRCPSTGSCDLFTMNPDGSGLSKVTRTASDELWPQWAADA